jgi:hypothetical protein
MERQAQVHETFGMREDDSCNCFGYALDRAAAVIASGHSAECVQLSEINTIN